MRLEFSSRSRQDLLDIGVHIAQDSIRQAKRVVSDLESVCALISEQPLIGRERMDMGYHIRSLAHKKYLIFYTVHDHTIRIERILHGARDAASQFDPSE